MTSSSPMLNIRTLGQLISLVMLIFGLLLSPVQSINIQQTQAATPILPIKVTPTSTPPPVDFIQATKIFTASANRIYNTIKVADLNNDGNLDFIVATNAELLISLGNGNNTFQPITNLNCNTGNICSPGTPEADIILRDFNNDNKIDIVLLNKNNVEALLGNGDGTFQKALLYNNGFSAQNIFVSDCNSNNKPDLVSYGNNTFSILLDDGNGGFQTPITSTFNTPTYLATIGDFNQDGKCDIVSFTNNNLTIAIGNGDGTFQNPTNIGTFSFITRLSTGDFNGDGKLDLVVVQTPPAGGSLIKIFLGTGAGTFASPMDFFGGVNVVDVTSVDLNHDNKTDLLLTNVYDWNIVVLIGNGDGTFQPADTYPVNQVSRVVAAGDFKKNGFPGLIVGADDGLFLVVNDSTGHYYNPMSYDSFRGSSNQYELGSFKIADFNKDGLPDAISSNPTTNGLRVMLGTGKGRFSLPNTLAISDNTIIQTVGDFNNDDNLDLVITNTISSTLKILPGNGDGTFGTALNPGFGNGITTVTAGDFNKDGKLDLATTAGVTLTVAIGNGDGTFQTPQNYNLGVSSNYLLVGDFTGDGTLDLAISSNGNNTILMLIGNGDGTFQASTNTIPINKPLMLCAGDFNNDNKLDIVALTTADLKAHILINSGNGSFQADNPLDVGFNSGYYVGLYNKYSLTVGDFNNDGNLDLVVSSPPDIQGVTSNKGVNVLVGNGDATFRSPNNSLVSVRNGQVVAADLDKDGWLDLVLLDQNWGHIDTLLNADSFQESTQLILQTSSVITTGIPTSLTLKAATQIGSSAIAYGGQVHFTSSDPLAQLPADYIYTSIDAGNHVFSATFNSVGTQTISATDIISTALQASKTIDVVACSSSQPVSVTTDNGSGQCGSLSYAIQQANQATQPVTITFSPNITNITLSNTLPPIGNSNGQRITLEGKCTTDSNNHKKAGLQLTFTGTGNSTGLTLTDQVTLGGIGVNGATGYAITVNGSYNEISCSTLGQTAGNTALGNGSGLYFGPQANHNLIHDNVIAGNRGPAIVVTGGKPNQMNHNRIGLDWNGQAAPNQGGIQLRNGGQLLFGPDNLIQN